VTDDQFYDLYSQLPYGSRFVAILDCCHSGGMTRAGGMKVRGIEPPDDIRHRMLRWDPDAQMWEERNLEKKNPQLAETNRNDEFTGPSRVELRLGRANFLRLPKPEQNRRQKRYGHKGPYMPVLLQACQANELSYEYRDGVTSYGAFTFALTTALRMARDGGTKITWKALVARTAQVLKDHDYEQVPAIAGPSKVISRAIPWIAGGSKNRASRELVGA